METNEQNELPIVNDDIEQEFDDALDEMPDITVTCQSAGCTAGTAGAAWSWTGDSAIAATHLQFHYTNSHSHNPAQTQATGSTTSETGSSVFRTEIRRVPERVGVLQTLGGYAARDGHIVPPPLP